VRGAARDGDEAAWADEAVESLLAEDARIRFWTGQVCPAPAGSEERAQVVHDWLAGSPVLGYGAASRAVPRCAKPVWIALFPAVVDAFPAGQGLRRPSTDVQSSALPN
jgi:hypothetical protein